MGGCGIPTYYCPSPPPHTTPVRLGPPSNLPPIHPRKKLGERKKTGTGVSLSLCFFSSFLWSRVTTDSRSQREHVELGNAQEEYRLRLLLASALFTERGYPIKLGTPLRKQKVPSDSWWSSKCQLTSLSNVTRGKILSGNIS